MRVCVGIIRGRVVCRSLAGKAKGFVVGLTISLATLVGLIRTGQVRVSWAEQARQNSEESSKKGPKLTHQTKSPPRTRNCQVVLERLAFWRGRKLTPQNWEKLIAEGAV